MTFKDKLEQYDSLLEDISETLTNFVQWLDTIDYDRDLNLHYGNKYSVQSTGEVYISHTLQGDYITICTEYECPWGEMDCNSETEVPISWVEAFANGEKESVIDEIIQDILDYDEKQYQNEIEYAKKLAERYNLFKEDGSERV